MVVDEEDESRHVGDAGAAATEAIRRQKFLLRKDRSLLIKVWFFLIVLFLVLRNGFRPNV